MFEQTFKIIDDVLWKEAGCANELDHTEQPRGGYFWISGSAWKRPTSSTPCSSARPIRRLSAKGNAGRSGPRPKKNNGTFDHDKARTGSDLID